MDNVEQDVSLAHIEQDADLVQIVYKELRNGFLISGGINRFGGFTVLAFPDREDKDHPSWQGDNVLAARKWVDAEEFPL
jgi:hypothetical protein